MEDHSAQGQYPANRMSPPVVRSSAGLPQRRFDGQYPSAHEPRACRPQLTTLSESWVEVSSQPSSSSLSSIGDEIVTTGLQVRSRYGRRRRMPASARSLPQQQTAIHNAGTSSQEEEYDDSDSDDSPVITSSTENVRPSQEHIDEADDSDADSDDGDNATALGRVSDRPIFRPQPNAFTHPSQLSHRSNSSSAAIPAHNQSDFTRPSFSQRSQTRVHRGQNSFMSPSAREDHDAALRASLTTLLSCAAAARGLPKSRDEMEARRTAGPGVGPSNQPMDLRLVPESELMDETSRRPNPTIAGPRPLKSRTSSSRSPSRVGASLEKSKRSASTGRLPRPTKKKKTNTAAEETLISPTLLTWVVSAGVVVLVSVVGFGAGYIIGREVGHQEALAASVGGVNETTSCGREVIRTSSGGLRRFKWSAVGKSIVA